ncbi:hypothetical protein K505DRAFT_377019 [Melanomma pulvis-pyrius CBS 109.77]|uniref:Membrane-associated proteins in eicosanoid and glutathione metabolism n=1 Tax=Melanomma pulvis-pyrius CBS 109.77 TaxID=1314802 RepID=A0A6A6X4T4_9PLEO|nr:hypothetical protein K505DRAFT_377019 [Melanomma pulvis-pyrius CBS 109.77]
MTLNLSIYAIPVYWVMALWPHALAAGILKSANARVDNANPRGIETNSKVQKSCPSEVYARWERAEAAHKNLLENAPLFIGAVIVGNMAKLPTSTLNTAVGTYLGLRAMYIGLYLNITSRKFALLRSINWAISIGVLFTVFVKAGNKLAYES